MRTNMRPKALMALIAPMGDGDYVTAFQSLSRVHLQIQKQGPRPRSLLRRAWLELAVGDFWGASRTAGEVSRAQPDNAEALFVCGEAYVRQALVKAGLLATGPGHPVPLGYDVPSLLERAREAYEDALASDDDDQEAALRIRLVDELAALAEDPARLVAVMQARGRSSGSDGRPTRPTRDQHAP